MNLDYMSTTKISDTRPTQALALSGGGVRGIMSVIILAEVERRVGAKSAEIFDLITGTSVGSLLAAGLSLKDRLDPTKPRYGAQDLVPIAEEKLIRAFSNTYLNEVETGDGLWHSKYKPTGLNQGIKEIFDHTLASDLLGEYYYPATNEDDLTQTFGFTGQQARQNADWKNLRVKDILRATTAAPTYFPPHSVKLDKTYHLIDGGVVENNPAPRAYALAKQIFNCQDNLTVLSIGTGTSQFVIHGDDGWGAIQWSTKLINTLSSGQEAVAHSLTDSLLNFPGQEQRGFIVQLKVSEEHKELDDVSPANIKYLEETAKSWLDDEHNNEFLERLSHRLKLKDIK